MKYLFPVFTLLLLNCCACGQATPKNKFNLGAGISLAIPVYNLDISSTGGGADILFQYGISDKISLTADAGFTGLPGKAAYPSTAIIPIRLGLRFFPVSKVYVSGKAGLGIYTILKASAGHAAFSASAGYYITKKLEASWYYDGYTNRNSSFGYTGLRIGYHFLH